MCAAAVNLQGHVPLALIPIAQYDEDVKLLTQKQDCKGDRVLVALVNVQLVVDQITSTTSQPYSGDQIPAIPLYLDSLQARLQAIRNEVPTGVAYHGTYHPDPPLSRSAEHLPTSEGPADPKPL